jgi:predicted nuclease of predicted toxin-antitoxin system
MRFLVDSCVSLFVCNLLKERGYSVEWVPDAFDGDPGDEAIIDKALQDGSVLITGDKDFGEWIFLRGKNQPPLVRLSAMSPENQGMVLEVILDRYSDSLKQGALITAGTEKIRIRKRN